MRGIFVRYNSMIQTDIKKVESILHWESPQTFQLMGDMILLIPYSKNINRQTITWYENIYSFTPIMDLLHLDVSIRFLLHEGKTPFNKFFSWPFINDKTSTVQLYWICRFQECFFVII